MPQNDYYVLNPSRFTSRFAPMDYVRLTRWLKAPNDTVIQGEPLFEAETDKTVFEEPAPFSGVITKILVPAGSPINRKRRLLQYLPGQMPIVNHDRPEHPGTSPSVPPVFDALWDTYQPLYRRALDKLTVRIQQLIEENTVPRELRVLRVSGRVKARGSTLDKATRDKLDPVDALSQLTDLVGMRVVCHNTEDVFEVLDVLKHQLEDDFKFVSMADYIQQPNEKTGYRGVHLLVETAVPHTTSTLVVTCEIQIRTLAQDLWSELSHADVYKNETMIPADVSRHMKEIGSVLALVDREATMIRSTVDQHVSANFLPYRLDDQIEADAFVSYLRDRHGMSLRGFWLTLHLTNFRKHNIQTLRQIHQIIDDRTLADQINQLAKHVQGNDDPLSFLDRLFFSVIAHEVGISAAESAMRSCLTHVAEREAKSLYETL